MMLEWFERFRSRIQARSKHEAKRRLQFLLVHERVNLTPAQMEKLKNEILQVISAYVEIDSQSIEIELRQAEKSQQMALHVPVKRVVERQQLASETPGT